MTTQEVANRLVELCRQGMFDQAQDELYSQDAESLEPQSQVPHVKGLEAIREKGKQFNESVLEFHSSEVSEPVVAGDYFSVNMKVECTFKEHGRILMEEICVYEVKEGKVVKEHFFYNM